MCARQRVGLCLYSCIVGWILDLSDTTQEVTLWLYTYTIGWILEMLCSHTAYLLEHWIFKVRKPKPWCKLRGEMGLGLETEMAHLGLNYPFILSVSIGGAWYTSWICDLRNWFIGWSYSHSFHCGNAGSSGNAGNSGNGTNADNSDDAGSMVPVVMLVTG